MTKKITKKALSKEATIHQAVEQSTIFVPLDSFDAPTQSIQTPVEQVLTKEIVKQVIDSLDTPIVTKPLITSNSRATVIESKAKQTSPVLEVKPKSNPLKTLQSKLASLFPAKKPKQAKTFNNYGQVTPTQEDQTLELTPNQITKTHSKNTKIQGILSTLQNKNPFKKNPELELTKSYIYHYNQRLARKKEKLYMNSVAENQRDLIINDKHTRIFYLADIPDYFAYNYILQILNCGLPINLNYYIKATSKSAYLTMLRTRNAILQGKQMERQQRGSDLDPHIEKEMLEVEHLIDEMVSGGQKTFLVSVYATITADNAENLKTYCYEFENLTKQLEIIFYTNSFKQKSSLPAILPLGNDTIKEKLNLQTNAVVEMFPFLAKNIQDNSGFYLGTSRVNYNSMVIFDPFKARNANILILGTSGSGKSVTSKSLLLKLVMRQVQCIILDPEGEYVPITNHYGGSVISFGQGRGLNIFDLEFASIESQRNHIAVLKNFFKFIIDEAKYSDSKLDLILTKLYKDYEEPTNSKKQPITMAQFIKIAREEKVAFLDDLLKLTEGSLKGIFDSRERLDLGSEIICFDLSNLGNDALKLPAMYLVASIIDNLIDRMDKKRMIFIDEAHLFLNREFTREFYIRLQKTARKRQAGVVSITQNAEDFREEGGSKTILTQAETVILLKQHTASINFLKQQHIFDLSEAEYNELYSLDKGEAILFREQEHINIYIEPFDNEWEFIAT